MDIGLRFDKNDKKIKSKNGKDKSVEMVNVDYSKVVKKGHNTI